jgi:hypothetical protein
MTTSDTLEALYRAEASLTNGTRQVVDTVAPELVTSS